MECWFLNTTSVHLYVWCEVTVDIEKTQEMVDSERNHKEMYIFFIWELIRKAFPDSKN
jgi:hypothetical protein